MSTLRTHTKTRLLFVAVVLIMVSALIPPSPALAAFTSPPPAPSLPRPGGGTTGAGTCRGPDRYISRNLAYRNDPRCYRSPARDIAGNISCPVASEIWVFYGTKTAPIQGYSRHMLFKQNPCASEATTAFSPDPRGFRWVAPGTGPWGAPVGNFGFGQTWRTAGGVVSPEPATRLAGTCNIGDSGAQLKSFYPQYANPNATLPAAARVRLAIYNAFNALLPRTGGDRSQARGVLGLATDPVLFTNASGLLDATLQDDGIDCSSDLEFPGTAADPGVFGICSATIVGSSRRFTNGESRARIDSFAGPPSYFLYPGAPDPLPIPGFVNATEMRNIMASYRYLVNEDIRLHGPALNARVTGDIGSGAVCSTGTSGTTYEQFPPGSVPSPAIQATASISSNLLTNPTWEVPSATLNGPGWDTRSYTFTAQVTGLVCGPAPCHPQLGSFLTPGQLRPTLALVPPQGSLAPAYVECAANGSNIGNCGYRVTARSGPDASGRVSLTAQFVRGTTPDNRYTAVVSGVAGTSFINPGSALAAISFGSFWAEVSTAGNVPIPLQPLATLAPRTIQIVDPGSGTVGATVPVVGPSISFGVSSSIVASDRDNTFALPGA